eukprot:m.437887 g.437887  ORF g.437887 m.437887 type:complete len:263 (-) comp18173_c0_seq1:60-848(-)
MSEVLFERKGHVAVFTLNRPKARNAVNAALSAQMEAHLDAFEADDDLWVGIVTSSTPGKAFSAGADLKEVSAGRSIESPTGGFAGLVRYPRKKPLIAAVDGPALAGGLEIVLACDLIVASSRSRFGVPEVKRSLIPGAGGVFRLPRRLPRNVALEMVLTGDPIPAVRANELGFVNVLVHDPSQVLRAAHELAGRIVANAPIAVREGLQLVENSTLATDEQNWEMSANAFRTLMKTEDYYEGPRAFVEKRAPKWTGKMRASKL